MLRIDRKLAQTHTILPRLREQVDQALANLAPGLMLSDSLNILPVRPPRFVNAPFGVMDEHLLVDDGDFAWRRFSCITSRSSIT